MKKYTFIYLFLSFCLLPGLLVAQAKEMPPVGGTPKDFKVPAQHTVLLDNGLKTVMVDYGLVPKVTIQLYIGAGPVLEPANKVGLASLLASLLEEGTATKDAKALSTTFAKMGGQLNINAGTHVTTVNATVLSEFAPLVIALFAEVIQNAALPASELDRLKSNLKRQNSVARSQPGTIANELFNQAIFGDHPYGRSIPSDEMVDGITMDDIRSFYQEEFGAKRSILYVVGKFDQGKVTAAVKDNFTDWTAGKELSYPEATPNMAADVALSDRPNSPQSTIRLGIPVPDPSHPDYVALEVMDDLLGGSFSSRITTNIREDKGYTYSPFNTLATRYKSTVWYQAADVTIESTKDALLEVAREINLLGDEVPTAEELNGIKNYMAGNFVLQNSSRGGIINQLFNIEFNNLPADYLEKRVQSIHAVTPEKIQEVADKYLDPDKMFLMVVGDEKIVAPQIEAYKQADKKFKKVVD